MGTLPPIAAPANGVNAKTDSPRTAEVAPPADDAAATELTTPRRSVQDVNKFSDFKGVAWEPTEGKWRAAVFVGGKREIVGFFETDEDAAYAYDARVLELRGEAAVTNFDGPKPPPEPEPPTSGTPGRSPRASAAAKREADKKKAAEAKARADARSIDMARKRAERIEVAEATKAGHPLTDEDRAAIEIQARLRGAHERKALEKAEAAEALASDQARRAGDASDRMEVRALNKEEEAAAALGASAHLGEIRANAETHVSAALSDDVEGARQDLALLREAKASDAAAAERARVVELKALRVAATAKTQTALDANVEEARATKDAMRATKAAEVRGAEAEQAARLEEAKSKGAAASSTATVGERAAAAAAAKEAKLEAARAAKAAAEAEEMTGKPVLATQGSKYTLVKSKVPGAAVGAAPVATDAAAQRIQAIQRGRSERRKPSPPDKPQPADDVEAAATVIQAHARKGGAIARANERKRLAAEAAAAAGGGA